MSLRHPRRRLRPLGRVVRSVNDLQDRIVERYFVPYRLTVVYWAFAVVFLYLGLQKVVPHRSTADVQLATVGGLLGLPYQPFVTVVGVWQLVVGLLFLLRWLRACAWFFLGYQLFTFATLVVLERIVFQPPWLTVAGVDLPWALGAYSAFVLKNVVYLGVFFVLASEELGAPARPDTLGATVRRWLSGRGGRVGLDAVRDRLARRLPWRVNGWQDVLVRRCFRPYGVAVLSLAFAFVWFYFGFQKPAPVFSPVRTPLSDFLPHLGVPLGLGMLFIGFYEMTLGLLFLLREVRLAFWLFFPHQAVTFLTLLVIPFTAFQPPFLHVLGLQVPWALTGYGAFVVKNVVFVAGFVLLASHELGTVAPAADDAATTGTPTADPAAAGARSVGEVND